MHLDQAPYIDPKLFVGRSSELGEMADVLKPSDPAIEQRRLVLGGIGGIGKTQLAIAYAKQNQDFYASTFWLNAMSEVTLKASIRSMAERMFSVKDYRVLDDAQILVCVKQWLADARNTRWLMIFDNYDVPKSHDIERYFPYCAQGAIVITTRLPDQVSGYHLRVRPLESVSLALQILEIRSQRNDLQNGQYFH